MAKKVLQTGAATAAPVTVEQLQKMLTDAGVDAAVISTVMEHCTSAAEAYEQKEQECIDLHKQVETLEAEVQAAHNTVKELEQALNTAEQQADAAADEIVVGKETYLVDAGNFSYKNEVVNAAELKKNPELAKELIQLGAGFIKKKGA